MSVSIVVPVHWEKFQYAACLSDSLQVYGYKQSCFVFSSWLEKQFYSFLFRTGTQRSVVYDAGGGAGGP